MARCLCRSPSKQASLPMFYQAWCTHDHHVRASAQACHSPAPSPSWSHAPLQLRALRHWACSCSCLRSVSHSLGSTQSAHNTSCQLSSWQGRLTCRSRSACDIVKAGSDVSMQRVPWHAARQQQAALWAQRTRNKLKARAHLHAEKKQQHHQTHNEGSGDAWVAAWHSLEEHC